MSALEAGGEAVVADDASAIGDVPHLAATRTAATENFPVGSWLLPKRLRGHVAAFYRFARTADDIADSPDLTREQKIAGLAAMGDALATGGDQRVDPVRASIAETGIGLAECRGLLVAFGRDARNQSCESWADLLDYCRYSAEPVGRYLLRLHGESAETYVPGDALCSAFQILNHLQDCGDDWRNLHRLYVPRSWIAAAGGEAAFFRPDAARLRRPVLDRCLDGADLLIETASRLPSLVRSRGLRAEVTVMLSLAHALSRRLREGDPIEARVALTKGDFVRALPGGLLTLVGGAVAPLPDRARVAAAVDRAGSSFTAGMKILPRSRRRGMYALYGFCRAVDDIADAPAPVPDKKAELLQWSEELGRLYAGQPGRSALARELARAITEFGLPRAEFDLVLEGMSIDSAESVRIPDRSGLSYYARRVAGAVGVLSCRIFGVTDATADPFAIYLGETLQLTNILRDIDEDAAIDRLYLPLDRVAAAGIATDRSAAEIAADQRLETVCLELAAEVDRRYETLADLAPPELRRELRSARLMRLGYEAIFRKLQARGWAQRRERPRLSRPEALAALISAYRS
jgi:phytoene synthase